MKERYYMLCSCAILLTNKLAALILQNEINYFLCQMILSHVMMTSQSQKQLLTN